MFMPSRACFAINDATLESNRETIIKYPLCCPCFCACSMISILTFGVAGLVCQPVDIFSENCCLDRKNI